MTSSIAGIWPVGRTSIRGNVVRSATWPDYSATRLGGWLPSSATLGYEDRFETCVCRGRVGYSPDVCHLPNPYQQRSGLDGSIFAVSLVFIPTAIVCNLICIFRCHSAMWKAVLRILLVANLAMAGVVVFGSPI